MQVLLQMRPLGDDDPATMAVAFQRIGWKKTEAQYRRYLEEQLAGRRVCRVAFADGRFAGYVTLNLQPTYPPFAEFGTPEIQDLNVLPKFRRQGAGSPYNKLDDWVFASPYTKGLRPFWPAQLLKTHIKPVALAAGLPSIGWHSFRHTVSAWGKEAGLELEDVKTLLRHEDIATTSNVYGDLGMDAKRRIQQCLVEFVKQQAEAQLDPEEAARREEAWKHTPATRQ